MKVVLSILVFLMLAFNVEAKEIDTPYSVLSTEVVEYDGIPYEIVEYSDGTGEVFNTFLYIKDVQLRKMYMTHLNIHKEFLKELAGNSVTSRTDDVVSDYVLFNLVLFDNEITTIPYTKYLNCIRLPKEKDELQSKMSVLLGLNTTQILFGIVSIAAFVLIAVRVARSYTLGKKEKREKRNSS